MDTWTHREPEPEGEYTAVCMASTACGHQAVAADADDAREMLTSHYVTDHHAGDWDKPLRGGR